MMTLPSNSQPLPQGITLGRGKYTLERVLGQGGFGYIYLARDQGGQTCAIKQCLDLSPAGLMQFGHEGAVQKLLDDAGFVRVYAQFVEKVGPANTTAVTESLFTVMEYVPGRSLEELLSERLQQNRGPFAERDAVAWIVQLLGALQHAHAVGVIHRDIKPGNILLLPDGRSVKVIDFGIAKIGGAGAQTLHGAHGVSPGYSPPEQYAQTGQTDAFSDIYAVGATLYHLVTGEAPLDAPLRLSGQPLIEPRRRNPLLSPLVEAVILCAMQLNVADRYQDAAAMLAALQGKSLLAAATGAAAAPPRLHVTPAQIDWGQVAFRRPPGQLLHVENSGGGRLHVSLSTAAGWLRITPATITLGPQEQQQVVVELAPHLLDMRGRHSTAIQITAASVDAVTVPVKAHLGGAAVLSAAPLQRLATLPDLIRWCDGHWQDAICMLRSGELAAAIDYLLKPAGSRVARRSAETPRAILDRVGQAGAAPNDNLALETALRAIGAPPPQCRHNWREVERRLGMGWRPDLRWLWPWWSGPGAVAFVIQNQGRGYLHGRLEAAVPWLEIPQPEFGCLAGQKQRIALDLHGQLRRLNGLAPEILVLQVN